MAIINVLDKDTINKIAAGEVIENPAAVVKELVENAIDAKANSVTVEIKDGGTSLIRVTDNGKGIGSDDIRTAFLPHATSKIRTAEDLIRVSSLGFRGEALASISAISETEVLTKTAEEISGFRYTISGGKELGLEPVGTPEGSTFIIKNIFYNTPARKKFLKTDATEGRYISEVMEHVAVSHPEVAFKFIANGQIKLQTLGSGSLKDVLFYIYGRETTNNIIAVNNPDIEGELLNGFSVRGYIGKPSLTRGNREYENYFINGRFIKNKVVTRAIEDAYKAFLMQHRYPFTCLLISADSSLIDVNVHPAKLEVRFSDAESVYKLIYNEVDKALRNKDLLFDAGEEQAKDKKPLTREFNLDKKPEKSNIYTIPDIPMPEPFERNSQTEWRKELKPVFKQESFVAESRKTEPEKPVIVHEVYAPIAESSIEKDNSAVSESFKSHEVKNPAPIYTSEIKSVVEKRSKEAENGYKGGIFAAKALPDIKLVGQIFGTYWIMEYDGNVYMIDQHAAHEKVMYERFIREMDKKKVASQNLLPSVVITLSESQRLIVEEIREHLEELGFEVEEFGGNEYVIKAVPTELLGMSERDMFIDIIDQYSLEGRKSTPDTVLSKLATMACKAAVKGNMKLSETEAKKLIEELMMLDNPYNCPHGRPTMIFMSKGDVEKKFKR